MGRLTPIVDNLRTIIQSDLGASIVPTATPATPATPASSATTVSSTAGAQPQPTWHLGVAGGAVAVAVGLVGLGLM